MEKDSSMCRRHPEEKLRFVCKVCDTLICRDCKLTQHEGHETSDVDLVASDVRQKLSKENSEVKEYLTLVTKMRDDCQKSAKVFETTLGGAKLAMNKKVDAVIEWAKTYRLAVNAKFEELKAQKNEEIASAQDYMDEIVNYSSQLSEAITQAVNGTKSDQYLFKFHADYSANHKGKYPTVSELQSVIPAHSKKVVTTGTSPDHCQKAVERYLGIPFIGEVRENTSNLSMCSVPRLKCSEEDDCSVTAILPAEDGSVRVLYQNYSSESAVTRFAMFTEKGKKRCEVNVQSDDMIMIESGSTSLAMFSPGSESFQHMPVAPETAISHDETCKVKSKLYYLKHRGTDIGRESAIYEMDCSRPWNMETDIRVVDLDVDDAVKVVANAKGRVFAVLRECNQIRVYRRHTQSSPTDFHVSTHLEHAIITDICFCPLKGVGEVLVVAEAHYGVLLMVDFEKDLAVRSFFPSPRPGLSAVCSDHAGALWVGCEAGEVFMCLPDSSNNEDEDIRLDADGYMLPEQIYGSILALNLGGDVEDTCPQTPPRKPLDIPSPVLQNKSTCRPPVHSEDEGPSILIKPPARRPFAVRTRTTRRRRLSPKQAGSSSGDGCLTVELYENIDTSEGEAQVAVSNSAQILSGIAEFHAIPNKEIQTKNSRAVGALDMEAKEGRKGSNSKEQWSPIQTIRAKRKDNTL